MHEGKVKRKRLFFRIRLAVLLLILALLVHYYYPSAPITGSYPLDRATYYEGELVTPEGFPPHTRVVYEDDAGNRHVYLVQESETVAGDAPVLVYLHGANGTEADGMAATGYFGSFARLRAELAARGWIYITPRDYDMDGLYDEILTRYGARPVYLAGHSAGGRETLLATHVHPDRYAGIMPMHPGIGYPVQIGRGGLKGFNMPIWMTCSDDDGVITPATRTIARDLRDLGKRLVYVEVPGGGHGGGCARADWPAALDFLCEE